MSSNSYYDKSNKTIYLGGDISSFAFYNDVLPLFLDYTNDIKNREVPPQISIEHLSWIDANVVPCLLVLGEISKKYYNTPITLDMIYNPDILQFLDATNFFYYAKRENLFSYNEDLVGGFGISDKDFNSDYRVEKRFCVSDYYELPKEKQLEKKYEIQDQLFRYETPRVFGKVLERIISPLHEDYYECIKAISEIMCNAILYSLSDSYTCVQCLKNRIQISICDSGIGFGASLEKSNKGDYSIIERAKINNQIRQSSILTDFFSFFVALNYSETVNRDNLWELKNLVTDNGGTIRFHINKTQIVFTYARCAYCEYRSAENCMNCVLNNYSDNIRLSPLRFYRARLDGVHIEIDFTLRGK